MPLQRHPVLDDGPDTPQGWDLVLRHRERLLRLAQHCGCTLDVAQDVVQEAHVRVATHPQLEANTAHGLLSTVVRRLSVDQHRDTLRQQSLAEYRQLDMSVPVDSHEHEVCDQAEGAWLHTQTTRLRPRERHALLERAAGRSTPQIADELDCTEKAVEMLHRRARLAMKMILAATWLVISVLCIGHLVGSRQPARVGSPGARGRVGYACLSPDRGSGKVWEEWL